jgi:hypothetical protein
LKQPVLIGKKSSLQLKQPILNSKRSSLQLEQLILKSKNISLHLKQPILKSKNLLYKSINQLLDIYTPPRCRTILSRGLNYKAPLFVTPNSALQTPHFLSYHLPFIPDYILYCLLQKFVCHHNHIEIGGERHGAVA